MENIRDAGPHLLKILLLVSLVWPLPAKAQWQQQYSTVTIGGLNGFWFQWPNSSGHVNYVVQPTGSLAGKQMVTISGSISGAPFQAWMDAINQPGVIDPTPASCRAYFQEAGDNWSGQGAFAYYRWWSHSAVFPLQNGNFWVQGSFTDLSQWSSVMGESANNSAAATQGFQQALASAQWVGFTCGGMFFGHGVYATQPGALTIMGYGIQ